MRLPTAGQWKRVRDLVLSGSTGIYPGSATTDAIQAVLNYVDDLESSLQGLTPEQVEAVPRLVANRTAPIPTTTPDIDAWAAEYESLAKLFPRREAKP